MKKIRKAVIPVAGMGTRLLPITKSIPKEMLPIIDKPTIHYIVEEAVLSGIEEILFITNSNKKSIENYFTRNLELEKKLIEKGKVNEVKDLEKISKLAKYFYINQEEPLGSGHAISLAKNFVNNEPFAVLYGDNLIDNETTPILKQLIDIYEKTNSNVIAYTTVPKNIVDRFGILSLNKDGSINSIIEKPNINESSSNLASIGRYIVNPQIFDYLEQIDKVNGEYQFTDALMNMMKKEKFMPCNIEGQYYDIGSKEGYLKANIEFALKNDLLEKEIEQIMKNI